MTSASIPIRNIYYMIAYAFRSLQTGRYRRLATEHFDNASDLYAAILVQGMSDRLKRGLAKGYMPKQNKLASPRGRIDFSASAHELSVSERRLVCVVDDFTADIQENRVIVSTLELLLHADIDSIRRNGIRSLLPSLRGIGHVDLRRVDWRRADLDVRNQTSRMLMGICHMAISGLLQSPLPGNSRSADFLDDQEMFRLYETFLRKYYEREWRGMLNVTHHRIPWDTDREMSDNTGILPIMQPDVVLEDGKDVLIIDAKYYTRTMQRHFDSAKLHSSNLYQIYAYVSNMHAQLSRESNDSKVSGMLLYARTDETVQPNANLRLGNGRVSVDTLDLNRDFRDITGQLDGIIEDHFPKVYRSHPIVQHPA